MSVRDDYECNCLNPMNFSHILVYSFQALFVKSNHQSVFIFIVFYILHINAYTVMKL